MFAVLSFIGAPALAAAPFVVVQDDNARLYVAEWSATGNTFVGYAFVDALRLSEGQAAQGRSVAIADFNSDGHPDIVAGRSFEWNNGTFTLFLNDGSNRFARASFAGAMTGHGWVITDAAAGDFDHDGNMDFAAAGNSDVLAVFRGDGKGGFSRQVLAGLAGAGRGLDAADFDQDGHLDLVRGEASGGVVRILRGNGDGTFSVSAVVADIGSDPQGIAAADFDGDGRVDVIASDASGGDPYFCRGLGGLAFANAVAVPSLDLNNYTAYAACDFDGDGHADIVAATYAGRRLHFFRGRGDGTFTNGVVVGATTYTCLGIAASVFPAPAGAPSVTIRPAQATLPAGGSVRLIGSASVSPARAIVTNGWDFGDGSEPVAGPGAPGVQSHTFASEGVYTARLRVADDAGRGAFVGALITVTGAAPIMASNAVTLTEETARDGVWPCLLAGSNFTADAEGVASWAWTLPQYRADFDSRQAPGWYATAGNWTVTNAPVIAGYYSYRQRDTVPNRTRNLFSPVIEGDFEVELAVQLLGGPGEEVHLLLCAANEYNAYEVLFRGRGANDVRVDRLANGGTTVLADMSMPRPFTTNQVYRLKAVRRGAILSVYVDGRYVTSVSDETYARGRIGLSTYRTDAVFDSLVVTPTRTAERFVLPVGEGTRFVWLRASDGAGQTVTGWINVTTRAGAAPTADAGGPYRVDEFSGDAYGTGWRVNLDGTGSSDGETAATNMQYVWDCGVDGFSGTVVNEGKWVTGSGGVSQSNALFVTGVNRWASTFCFSREAFPRAAGWVFEAHVIAPNRAVVGLLDDGGGFGFGQMPYAIAFDYGSFEIWEYGSTVRTVGGYAEGSGYDIRIEPKPFRGARYWIRRDGQGEWNLLHESDQGTVAAFRRGADVYQGTLVLDDVREIAVGRQASARFYGAGTHPVTLRVVDAAGNSRSDAATVTAVANRRPTARVGPDREQVESNAVDRAWTFQFLDAGSTDDHGLFLYEWDWSYDGTFSASGVRGTNVTHTWTNWGVYTIALRVTDHAGQTAVDAATVTIRNGSPPRADPGGPYVVDEFTGEASTGAWNVVLSSPNSTDADSALVQYVWNLGADGFTGTRFSRDKWLASQEGVSQSNALTVVGAGSWGARYCFSRDLCARRRGAAFQARIQPNGVAFAGFLRDGASHSYGDMPHALYFNGGTLYVYENGSSRGAVGSYAPGSWCEIRIELKEGAGARYSLRPDGASPWQPLFDSDSGSGGPLRRGLTVYTGSVSLDDVQETVAGNPASYRAYGAGTRAVSLTVWDQALNADTRATTLVTQTNAPPVADAGPDLTGTEENAAEGIWSLTFDASRSTDDHGVYRYEWDWAFDRARGFRPSGDEGPVAIRSYGVGETGIHTVAVRVTDHVLQTGVDTAAVSLRVGQPPVADAGDNVRVEAGAPAPLDGTRSSDDVRVERYVWSFGDGTTGEGSRPFHVYRAPSNYTASLVVYDAAGQASASDTVTVTVVVGGVPVAVAGGPYTCGAGGPPAYLDASRSSDAGQPGTEQRIVTHLWDMDLSTDTDGDGNPANDLDDTGVYPFRVYPVAGVYTARLTVVDGAGQSNTADALIQCVSNLAPEVICVMPRGDPAASHPTVDGATVTLRAIVRDAGSLWFQWDFGDGTPVWPDPPGVVADPYRVEASHVYRGSAGRPFIARLTVWDGAGLTGSDEYPIVIRPDSPATRAELSTAGGLWWLHGDQDKDTGVWRSPYGGYPASAAASALQAFEVNGHRRDGSPRDDPYVETVRKGFEYLFSTLRTYAIGPEAGYDPDSNGNGIGIGVNSAQSPYESGMAMDAIASSQTPLGTAPRGAAGIKGRSFRDILTDMADQYAYGQGDGANSGGWRYGWNGGADNSVSQWGAIGLIAARDNFGIAVPPFVMDRNLAWLRYSFSGALYGYTSAGVGAADWYASTPSALIQLAMDGVRTTNRMWQAAEDSLARAWPTGGSASRNYYAAYAMVKAMRLAKPEPIRRLRANGLDWYEDAQVGLMHRLLEQQTASGAWDAYYSETSGGLGRTLSTSWAVLMLSSALFALPPKAVIDIPPVWGYGRELFFNAARSFHGDPDRAIVRYQWDFDGDGRFDLDTTDPQDPAAAWTYPDPTPGQAGDPPRQVSVRLRVTDDGQPPQSDETAVTLTVAEPPHAPYARSGGPYRATVGIAKRLNGSASFDIDPTDFITRYAWDFDHDDAADWVTNRPDVARVYTAPGTFFLALQVWDNGVLNGGTNLSSTWDYTTVNVSPNLGPSARHGGPYVVPEDGTLSLDGRGSSDPNGDPLLYAWDVNLDGIVDSTNPVVTLAWRVAGTQRVALAVSDTLLTSAATTTVVVLQVNDPPVFRVGPDLSVAAGAGPQSVAGWATGIGPGAADEAGQTLTFVTWTDNDAIFDGLPAVDADGTLRFTPSVLTPGQAWVSILLRDDGGTAGGGTNESAVQRFLVTVRGGPDVLTARVQCVIAPDAAPFLGARWRLTGGPDVAWHESGQTSDPLDPAAGPVNVAFAHLPGWTAPADVTGVILRTGTVATVQARYVAEGMQSVPGGSFLMGGADGRPVRISAFRIDPREVTVGEYLAFGRATGRPAPPAPAWGWGATNLPMVRVTWEDAAAFARWMGKRLPTEAEFEYLMRGAGASSAVYPWGDDFSSNRANCLSVVGRPTVAGAYPATWNGVVDLAGNVWEWCSDWYEALLHGEATDPTGPASGEYRVIRGGSWVSTARKLACSARHFSGPETRRADLGFRCATEIEGAKATAPGAGSGGAAGEVRPGASSGTTAGPAGGLATETRNGARPPLAEEGPWAGAYDLSAGWKWSEWFGLFNDNLAPWIYHRQHTWMYGLGTNVSSLWFWNLDMGWLWTGDTVYPYLYSMDQASWLLYQTNTASPRLFHNLSTRRWERR